MNIPIGFADAFQASFAGRRFLLNLLVGIERGDFSISGNVKALFQRWFAEITTRYKRITHSDVLDCLRALEAVSAKHFGGFASTKDICDCRKDLDHLSRLIDVDALAIDDYSIIDPSVVAKYKPVLAPDDKFDDLLNAYVESLSGDANSLRPGAVLRGRLPLSWAAPAAAMDAGELLQTAACRSDKLRNLVATPHYPDQHYLHRIEYPVDIARAVGAFRPTALEAGPQPYFRAKTDGKDSCGRTVNLEHIGAGIPQDIGVPEVLVPTVPVNEQFTWASLGRVEDAPASPDTAAHEASLYDSPSKATFDTILSLIEDAVR